MFKKILSNFMVISIIAIMGLGSCLKLKNENDNKDKEALALGLILLNQQGKQTIVPVAVSNATMSAVQSAVQSPGQGQQEQQEQVIGYKDLKNPEFLLAYSKKQFEKKFPYLKLTVLSTTEGSCSYDNYNGFNCNATFSGEANCLLGGTVTYNDIKIQMNGTFVNFGGNPFQPGASGSIEIKFTSSMNGSVSFSNCKITYFDWGSVTINTVTLNGDATLDYSGSQSGTTNFTSQDFNYNPSSMTYTYTSTYEGTVNESGTVSISNFSVDGNSVPNQNYTSEVSLNVNQNRNTTIYGSSDSYTSTQSSTTTTKLNGYVKVNGITVKEFNNYEQTMTCDQSGCR